MVSAGDLGLIRCGGWWGLLGLGLVWYRSRINSGLGRLGWVWMVQYRRPSTTLIVTHSQFSDHAALTHGPNSLHSAIIAVISIGSFHSVSHLIDHFSHPFNYSSDTIYQNNLEKKPGPVVILFSGFPSFLK